VSLSLCVRLCFRARAFVQTVPDEMVRSLCEFVLCTR